MTAWPRVRRRASACHRMPPGAGRRASGAGHTAAMSALATHAEAPRTTAGGADPTAAFEPAAHAYALKQGVALGGLGPDQRELVLGLAWAALAQQLPAPAASERLVNDALRHWLSAAGAPLRTDHVELRRWLVDGQWLQRDGFGRAYACAPASAQPAARQPLLHWLQAGPDRGAQVQAWRAAEEHRRALRRQAWAQRPAGT